MSTITVPTGRVRQVATAYAIRPGWLALLVTIVAALALGELPLAYQYAPLLVSVVFIGLPHGAVDHLVMARHRGESLTRRWLALVGLIYLVLGGLYGLVWFLFPVAAFAFFIGLTWFHWGQGELYPLVEIVGSSYLRRPSQKALTVGVRGGAPMALPLVAFPEQYQFVATSLIGLFDAGAAGALAPLFEPTARAVVAGLYGVAALATVVLGFHGADEREPWLVDTGEIGLLTVYFLVVPPILAIGIYFCFWHSLRHVIRTVLLHDRSVGWLENGQLGATVRQFAWDAAPMTAGALLLLGGLYLLVPAAPQEVADLVGLYLALIAMLTLPHVAIVVWLDRAQGLL
ncbi:MAG: Brp/Blh family beta-carotene 15,15'-dioxygenase [Halovenus sp.]